MNAVTTILRRTSVRVALGATLVVAVAYLVISGAVLAMASSDLMGSLDRSLVGSLEHIRDAPDKPGTKRGLPPGRSAFGPVLLVWRVDAARSVTGETEDATLPDDALSVTDPTTVAINGEDVRVTGADTADGRVIVGQSMASVEQAQGTILLAVALIGPALLTFVFVGAMIIGRRVAAPIERAHRRQLEFTADASHELRTPIAVIEAQTSLALSRERPAEWNRQAFERVGQETKRLRKLVDDLLWLARFDAGAPAPASEPVDIGVVAEGTVDRFRIVAETRGLTLTAAAAEGLSIVDVPAEWADRLLAVLLDNACKYAPTGGTVDLRVSSGSGRVTITVDDSGPGIDPAERDRIFDRFHRATDTHTGTGLGLSIADAIVRATDGRWRIGTSPSGGASMSVSWPMASLDLRGEPMARSRSRSRAGSRTAQG